VFRVPSADDRQRPKPMRWLWLGPPLDRGDAGWFRRGVRALHPAGPLFPALLLVMGVAIIGVLASTFGPFVIFLTVLGPVAASIILVVVTLALAIGAGLRAQVRVVRRSMLAAGRCPSCGYGLDGLEVEPDGCVVCPECGGAWDRQPRPESEVVVVSRDADRSSR